MSSRQHISVRWPRDARPKPASSQTNSASERPSDTNAKRSAAARPNRPWPTGVDQAAAAEHQAHAEKLAYLALFVSGALKKAAREGWTTTWEENAQKTGQRQLTRLTYQDKLSVLATIEKNTLPSSPLWSAVLAAAGTGEALRLHREVSHLLQRDVLTKTATWPSSSQRTAPRSAGSDGAGAGIRRRTEHHVPAYPAPRRSSTGTPSGGLSWLPGQVERTRCGDRPAD